LLNILYTNMSANENNLNRYVSYECNICDFITSNKKDFTRHTNSNKHKRLTNPNILNPNPQIKKEHFECKCGNIYKHATNLSRHKKNCLILNKKDDFINDVVSNNHQNLISNLLSNENIKFQKIETNDADIYIIVVSKNN